jgi:hypothetical protein
MKALSETHVTEVKKIRKELLTDASATYRSYNRCLNRLEEIRKENNFEFTEWNNLLLTL